MSETGFILEDNPPQQRLMKRKLEHVGLEVVVAGNVELAKQIFTTRGRIYILDMKTPMSDSDAADYCAGPTLRQHLIGQGIDEQKILLMSAEVSDNDVQTAERFGVDSRTILSKATLTVGCIRKLLSSSEEA